MAKKSKKSKVNPAGGMHYLEYNWKCVLPEPAKRQFAADAASGRRFGHMRVVFTSAKGHTHARVYGPEHQLRALRQRSAQIHWMHELYFHGHPGEIKRAA